MNLHDALAAAPTFHLNWWPILAILAISIAVPAWGFATKRAYADVLVIAATTLGVTAAGVAGGAQLGAAHHAWETYVSEQVAAYVNETHDLLALSPVTIEENSASFLAAEPDGDLVDVKVTWLPEEPAAVLDGADLPEDMQTVAVQVTPTTGR